MKKKLFFLCLIFLATETNAMKRLPTRTQKTRPCKKQAVEKQQADKPPFFFDRLPADMQNIIIEFSTINTTSTEPKECAHRINALAHTNKKLNLLINKQNFSDNLIKIFSKKFCSSQETIARSFHTEQANKRLTLQNELKNLCSGIIYINPEEILDTLIERGVDLDFTYEALEKTPLMITVKNNLTVFKLLIKKGAPLNTQDSRGLTVLNIATEYPIDKYYLVLLLTKPLLMIDQRNHQGETALLHCLINRKINPLTNIFRSSIKKLLKSGADPELADNSGYTPLKAAQALHDQRTIELIKKAIDKKYTDNQHNTPKD